MKVVFIGVDLWAAEAVNAGLRLRWPDALYFMASTAAEGLAKAKEAQPDLALIHTDLTDMALSSALLKLRRVARGTSLLVLGYNGSELERLAAMLAGADDYLRMPCYPMELSARMLALVSRPGARDRWRGNQRCLEACI